MRIARLLGIGDRFEDPELAASESRLEENFRADEGLLLNAVICVVFAFPPVWFAAAVGIGLYRAHEARDWLPVKAMVEEASRDGVAIRYEAEGRTYVASRFTFGEFNIDRGSDWRRGQLILLASARATRTPVTVYVDPRDASQAVVAKDFPYGAFGYCVVPVLFSVFVFLGSLSNVVRLVRGNWPGTGEPIVRLTPNEKLVRSWALCFVWNFIAFVWAEWKLGPLAAQSPWSEAMPAAQAFGVVLAIYLAWKTWRRFSAIDVSSYE